MIPVRDCLPRSRRVIVTPGLIALSLALFVLELRWQVSGELGEFLQTWGMVPDRLSQMMGEIAAGTWLALPFLLFRLLLGMFLHGSFAQILGNLLFLWVFGRSLESRLGHGKFLGLYLLGGIVTSLLQVWVDPELESPLIGANGAIATVLGAYLVLFPTVAIESVLPLLVVFIPVKLPALVYLAGWFGQQLFYGIGTLTVPGGVNPWGVAYWLHGAGLLLGAGLMGVAQRVDRQKHQSQ